MNDRLLWESDSLLDLMQSHICRAIRAAIIDRVSPDMQNKTRKLSSDRIGPELCTSSTEDGIGIAWKNTNKKITMKDSRSACDFREDTDFTPYIVIGANDHQHPITEFPTRQIQSQLGLQRPAPAHDTTMDTTLPVAQTVPVEQLQDPINRLVDVPVNLESKPQSMTIRPVTTTSMTFDGKTNKWELFEDLLHTMESMQPAMTEQMESNHFHSPLQKNALQTFRNLKLIICQLLEDVFVR